MFLKKKSIKNRIRIFGNKIKHCGYKYKFDRKKYLKKLYSISFFFKNSLCNDIIKANNSIKFFKKVISLIIIKRRIKGFFYSKSFKRLYKIKDFCFNTKFKEILVKNNDNIFLKGNFWINLSCLKRLINLINFFIVDLNCLKKRKVNLRFLLIIEENYKEGFSSCLKVKSWESIEFYITLDVKLFKDIIFT